MPPVSDPHVPYYVQDGDLCLYDVSMKVYVCRELQD